jgi:SAM-dependent methyltransferase
MAAVYARTRPGYPVDAARWLVGDGSQRVLELGAGTGKLTATLVELGHRVTATDPSEPMLRRLRKHLPSTRLVQSRAEQIPVHAGAIDVVVAAQSFHWFDVERVLPEVARILVPGGTLALVWNDRDESVPWVRRLSRILGEDRISKDEPLQLLEDSTLFDGVETATFRHWQQVDRDMLVGLVESRSYVATLDDRNRSALLAKVTDLYDEYGRGHDGMLLPYLTRCYRAHIDSTHHLSRRSSSGFDDGLLIDFS